MPKFIITFDVPHLTDCIREFPTETEAQIWAADLCLSDGMLGDSLPEAYMVEPYTPELAEIYELEEGQ